METAIIMPYFSIGFSPSGGVWVGVVSTVGVGEGSDVGVLCSVGDGLREGVELIFVGAGFVGFR